MSCQYIFCQDEAISRLTMPTVAPKSCFCAKHLQELLQHKNAKKVKIGYVIVENV